MIKFHEKYPEEIERGGEGGRYLSKEERELSEKLSEGSLTFADLEEYKTKILKSSDKNETLDLSFYNRLSKEWLKQEESKHERGIGGVA